MADHAAIHRGANAGFPSTTRRAAGHRADGLTEENRFIGRFLQHVLPAGFKRIRHYGLLSPALKTERLAMARAALDMPAANAQAREDAAAFLKRVAGIDIAKCPHCHHGRWLTIEIVLPARGASSSTVANCRGPP